MADNTAPQSPNVAVGATRHFAVSFVGQLDLDEYLSGTPTVAEQTTSDLTIANRAVSTEVLVINGVEVAVGKAVQFTVTGQQAATSYSVKITAATDSTPAQTLVAWVSFVGVES